MPKFQKTPNDYFSFGQVSTHPLRQKLIDYSKTFDQTHLKKYVLKYYQGDQYFNLNLKRYIIQAHNYIEANVIIMDYLNLKLKTAVGIDQYETLQEILEDDYDENFDTNGNLIFSETSLDENDTLWLEEIEDKSKQIILTFQG
jgi:xylose isomerase